MTKQPQSTLFLILVSFNVSGATVWPFLGLVYYYRAMNERGKVSVKASDFINIKV